MKSSGRLAFTVALLLTLTSCEGLQAPTVKTLYLNHHKVECAGPFLRLCTLDKENADGTWLYRYSDVIGLEYEWGYIYKLRVREEKIQDPLPDMSSITTTLLEVLSKEEVAPGARFQIELTTREGTDEYSEQFIVQKAANLFEFHSAREFTCSEEVCSELSGLLDENFKVTLEFSHPENQSDPLFAHQIVNTEALPEYQPSE